MKNLKSLIVKSIKGHERAQRELYLLYRTKWYMQSMRYAKNRFEADDILQEGLIEVFRDLYQFDSDRASFETWSSRVITYAALRYLKRNSWHKTFEDVDEIYDAASEEESVYEKLAAKELILLIQQLPLGYRLVFNMYVIEGYKHHEIAERLDIKIGTSKSQLSKAKKMLREKIEFHLTEYSKK